MNTQVHTAGKGFFSVSAAKIWAQTNLPSSQFWQQGQVEVLFGEQKLGPEQCKPLTEHLISYQLGSDCYSHICTPLEIPEDHPLCVLQWPQLSRSSHHSWRVILKVPPPIPLLLPRALLRQKL